MIIPYDYQQKNVSDVRDFIMNNQGNILTYAPTAAGKSVMMGASAIDWINSYNNINVLILAGRKELIRQNYDAVLAIDPKVDAGIYSAGIGIKEANHRIVVASIQSVFRKPELFRHINLIITDEAHNIDPEEKGMYRTFMSKMLEANPHIRVSGYTASPFRTKNGYIFGKDKFFSECLETKSIPELIGMGRLCPIVPYGRKVDVDFNKIHLKAGDFNEKELNSQYTVYKMVEQVCDDILVKTTDRNHCIIFAISIEHAEMIKQYITYKGQKAEVVHSKVDDRDEILKSFQKQEIKYLVNVDILTEGFDAKFIDVVAMIRPTMSPGLYLQIVGRGMRVHSSKTDCLFLDYGNNIQRHGCIDDINVKEPCKKPTKEGTAPVRECPDCGVSLHTKIRKCPNCGYVFPYVHEVTSSDESVLKKPKQVDIAGVTSGRFICKSGREAFKISFLSDFTRSIDIFLFPEDNNLRGMSRQTWKSIFNTSLPYTIDQCAEAIKLLKVPERIEIIKSGKYWKFLRKIK